MSKHKKTRKEKVIADYRHQVYILKNNPALPTPIKDNSYSDTHVSKDILKTGALSFFIVAVQMILFFLLKKHTILIPNLNY